MEPIIHPNTESAITQLLGQPPHALLISGPRGVGKLTLARGLAARLLEITPAALGTYPYFTIIAPDKPDSMTIEQIRGLQRSLTLKVPGHHTRPTSRVIILDGADLLTQDAQNAFLKTLEEPPEKTMLILTASIEQALLPTVKSRLQTLSVTKPTKDQLVTYFTAAGHAPEAVLRAMRIGGSLPGLLQAILDSDTEHPLLEATGIARELLQATRFDRLARVDELSKNKPLTLNVLAILQQMAETALTAGPSGSAQARWAAILKASFEAQAALLKNAQNKLVLVNLMLGL